MEGLSCWRHVFLSCRSLSVRCLFVAVETRLVGHCFRGTEFIWPWVTGGDGRFFYSLVLWTSYQTKNHKNEDTRIFNRQMRACYACYLTPRGFLQCYRGLPGTTTIETFSLPYQETFCRWSKDLVNFSSCSPHSRLSVNTDISLCRQVVVFVSHSKQILCVWSLISASSFRHSSFTLDSVWRSDPCRVAWRNIQYNSVHSNCRDPALLDWYIAVCFCYLLARSTRTRPAYLLCLVLKILVIVQDFFVCEMSLWLV